MLNDVPQSKHLIYEASAFAKSSQFLLQLWIYGTINPFEEYSAEELTRNGQKRYASPVVTIAEGPFFRGLEHKAQAPVFNNLLMVLDHSKEIGKNQ